MRTYALPKGALCLTATGVNFMSQHQDKEPDETLPFRFSFRKGKGLRNLTIQRLTRMPLERQLQFRSTFRDLRDLIMTSPPTPSFVVKLHRSSLSTWIAIFVSKGKVAVGEKGGRMFWEFYQARLHVASGNGSLTQAS